MSTLRSPAILAHRHGGPDVLTYCEVDVPDPAPGQVRIVQHAIGLNYADVYQRQGAHGPHTESRFPLTLGSQGAGVIESIGDGVVGFEVGQSVTYLHPGAYSAVRCVPASRTLPLPEGLSLETAAGTLLRGMTAEYLLHRLYTVRPGDRVLVHAAAGGMGVILSAWARALGAEVIGTAGSPEKVAIALAHGCHHAIDYRRENFVDRVRDITGGEGVSVVYDAVGRAVFLPSLDCLRPRGMAISFGTASGDVEAFDLQRLHAKSLTVCRPTLRSFTSTRAELEQSAEVYADAVRAGAVKAEVNRRYRLQDAAQAHHDLESRTTVGAAIFIP